MKQFTEYKSSGMFDDESDWVVKISIQSPSGSRADFYSNQIGTALGEILAAMPEHVVEHALALRSSLQQGA